MHNPKNLIDASPGEAVLYTVAILRACTGKYNRESCQVSTALTSQFLNIPRIIKLSYTAHTTITLDCSRLIHRSFSLTMANKDWSICILAVVDAFFHQLAPEDLVSLTVPNNSEDKRKEAERMHQVLLQQFEESPFENTNPLVKYNGRCSVQNY